MAEQGTWGRYLDQFHAERSGITERVLRRCRAPLDAQANASGEATRVDPYQWLAAQAGSSGRVLDLACGSAPLYDELASSHAYLGLDTSVAELRLAVARGAPTLVAEATRLPLAPTRWTPSGARWRSCCCRLRRRWKSSRASFVPADVSWQWCRPPRLFPQKDRLTYARLLLALRTAAFRYPQDAALAAIAPGRTAYGLQVVSDERRRFSYPLTPGAGALLLESLYLPDVTEQARSRASRQVTRCRRGELGVPLRLLVLRKPD